MPSFDKSDDRDKLKALTEEKEIEWRQALQLRINTLEENVNTFEVQIKERDDKLSEITNDFKYNLVLLSERDKELENLDKKIVDFQGLISQKDTVISELKIQVSKLQENLSSELKKREELQLHHKKWCREKEMEFDRFSKLKADEFENKIEELQDIRRKLENSLHETEAELEMQQKILSTQFDDEMRTRENEIRANYFDDLQSLKQAHLRLKIVEKENEILQKSNEKLKESLTESEKKNTQLEQIVQTKSWEIEDVLLIKANVIKEKECEFENLKRTSDNAKKNLIMKQNELERTIRDKDEIIRKLKVELNAKDQFVHEQIQKLMKKHENKDIEYEESISEIKNELRIRNDELTHTKEHLVEMEAKCTSLERHKEEMEISVKEQEESLHQNNIDLRKKLDLLQAELNRYKSELSSALSREQETAHSVAMSRQQLSSRLEGVRIEGQKTHLELTQKLIQEKNAIERKCDQLEREISELNTIILSEKEKNRQASQLLFNHGIKFDDATKNLLLADEDKEIKKLRKQNQTLRDVVQQMRIQLGELKGGIELKHNVFDFSGALISTDYIKALENEVTDLKSRLFDQTTSSDALLAAEKAKVLNSDKRVAQLQSIIHQLEDKLSSERRNNLEKTLFKSPPLPTTVSPDSNDIQQSTSASSERRLIINLQRKLASCISTIKQLASEKQQIHEVANRLRAELNMRNLREDSRMKSRDRRSNGGDGYDDDNGDKDEDLIKKPPAEITKVTKGKLSQLENLQYELTKQQLKFAGKKDSPRIVDDARDKTPPDERYSSHVTKLISPRLKRAQRDRRRQNDRYSQSTLPTEKYLRPSSSSSLPSTISNATLREDGDKQYIIPTRSSPTPEMRSAAQMKKDDSSRFLRTSSLGGNSLEDVWKILDDRGASPTTLFTPIPQTQ